MFYAFMYQVYSPHSYGHFTSSECSTLQSRASLLAKLSVISSELRD